MLPLVLEASPLDVARRLVQLAWGVGRFGIARLGDRLAGRTGPRQLGRRLRQAFVDVGGIAAKVGQQMSIRLDLLPVEVCEELEALTDRVPPSAWPWAEARMEAAFGRPLSEVLREINRDPVGSASIAVVYRAVLHTGEAVAIKVRRPAIDTLVAADLTALDVATAAIEAIGIVRPGFFGNLRLDIRAMLVEEIDFISEARYQRIYPRYLAEGEVPGVRAPAVHPALCSVDVLVSEFVEGVPAAEVLHAIEHEDEAALARLAAMDIHPDRVKDHLVRIAYWNQVETPLFHADPHPGNVIIRPGSEVVLLDFGAMGVTSSRNHRLSTRNFASLAAGRPSDAADVALLLAAPYPNIDLNPFIEGVERIFGGFWLGVEDPHAPWFARTSAALWLAFLDYVRDAGLQVNRDSLRLMRSSLLYDTLATRFHAEGDFKPVEAYLEGLVRRRADQAERKLCRRTKRGPQAWLNDLSAITMHAERLADTLAASTGTPRSVAAVELGRTAALVGVCLRTAGVGAALWVVAPTMGTGATLTIGGIGAAVASRHAWWALRAP